MLKIHYNEKQICSKHIDKCTSKSPLKPKLVLNKLISLLDTQFYKIEDIIPLKKDDFKIAHTEKYINSIYENNKDGDILENRLPWSNELLESLEYTNGSLYQAIKYSIKEPENIHISLTSGFHHAQPNSSFGFCTFSGQCIASLKLYNELMTVGCYIDLDAHFGNSIEDTRKFNKTLNNAIPRWANYNPPEDEDYYIQDFMNFLYNVLEPKIKNGECHYIVYCHGADSIKGDDLDKGVLIKDEWINCSHVFWTWYNKLCDEIQKYIPVTLSLFGGYREKDYDYVINAHVEDIILAHEYNKTKSQKNIQIYNIDKTQI